MMKMNEYGDTSHKKQTSVGAPRPPTTPATP